MKFLVAIVLVLALALAVMLIPALMIWWLYNSYVASVVGGPQVGFWVVYVVFIILRLVSGNTGGSSSAS